MTPHTSRPNESCRKGQHQSHQHPHNGTLPTENHAEHHGYHHCHCHSHGDNNPREVAGMIVSAVMLVTGLAMDSTGIWPEQASWLRLTWYVITFLPVGSPVLKAAATALYRGDWMNEFTLMGIATAGAFVIGEYPEAAGVMLFYAVGEYFQGRAVSKARHDIEALIELRPEKVNVIRHGQVVTTVPEEVFPGETIRLNAGDRIPLDGILTGDTAAEFDTSALTGESVPRTIEPGGRVSAGMLCIGRAIDLTVTHPYSDSSLARILEMVRHAAAHKAPAEQFIRRFSRFYTPAVVALAAMIALLPPLANLVSGQPDTAWSDYFYRALVFLVVSCPCALVISVPLSYFSGIGLASRRGILFKGGNYLDALAKADTVIFDKTGTLTQGEFIVAGIQPAEGSGADALLHYTAAAESRSSHPLARAIVQHATLSGHFSQETAAHQVRTKEISGRGLHATIEGNDILAGNRKLLEEHGIALNGVEDCPHNEIVCAINGRYAGRIMLHDAPRPESATAVKNLKAIGIQQQTVLSGDRTSIVAELARSIGINDYYGNLLPEDKVTHLQRQLETGGTRGVVFVGDGINDAPALALATVGIAMGGTGSDAAVETADVVIQSDNPEKVAEAIRLARATRRLVCCNIALAIGIKAIVLLLGAFGMAPLWAAVLADTGVAFLCILNVFTLPRLFMKSC